MPRSFAIAQDDKKKQLCFRFYAYYGKVYPVKLKITKFLQENTLYKNSLYVMASNMVLIGSGFLFWIIAARLYGAAQIGIATSLYSLLTLLSTLSLLGFNSGLMRF